MKRSIIKLFMRDGTSQVITGVESFDLGQGGVARVRTFNVTPSTVGIPSPSRRNLNIPGVSHTAVLFDGERPAQKSQPKGIE